MNAAQRGGGQEGLRADWTGRRISSSVNRLKGLVRKTMVKFNYGVTGVGGWELSLKGLG